VEYTSDHFSSDHIFPALKVENQYLQSLFLTSYLASS